MDTCHEAGGMLLSFGKTYDMHMMHEVLHNSSCNTSFDPSCCASLDQSRRIELLG